MKKKNYEKPSMKVVVSNRQPRLLVGSNYGARFGEYSAGSYSGYEISTEDLD